MASRAKIRRFELPPYDPDHEDVRGYDASTLSRNEILLALLSDGIHSGQMLVERSGMTRGRVYWGLRSLMAQALVWEPEHARYTLTMRGQEVAAGVLSPERWREYRIRYDGSAEENE